MSAMMFLLDWGTMRFQISSLRLEAMDNEGLPLLRVNYDVNYEVNRVMDVIRNYNRSFQFRHNQL